MKTKELFCGTKSFSNVAKELNFETKTYDNDKSLNPDICINILDMQNIDYCNILWCSPPCTTFSVSSIGTHWTGGKGKYIPKSEQCKIGLNILDKTIKLISISKPKYWFIENPMGVMRKVIDDIFKKYGVTEYKREDIWYCQYGDNRAKPTDIWTNVLNWKGKKCKNNNPNCHHERAPRGSRTGTQGLKNAKIRGQIPSKLFEEIFEVILNETNL